MNMSKELAKKMPQWVARGWVSAEGAESILKSEDSLVQEKAGSTFRTILAAMGAILLGFGLLSFVAANWGGISPSLKSLLVVSTLWATLAVAFKIQSWNTRPFLTEAIFLLAVIVFGANIGLQAQIFHIPSRDNSGLLLWFAGALACAWAGRSVAASLAGMAIAFGWACLELTSGLGHRWGGGAPISSHPFLWMLPMWLAVAIPVFRFSESKSAKIAAASFFMAIIGGAMIESVLGRGRFDNFMHLASAYVLALMILLLVARRFAAGFKDAEIFEFAAIKVLAVLLFAFTFRGLSDHSLWRSAADTRLPLVFGAILMALGGYSAAKSDVLSNAEKGGFALMGSWALLLMAGTPPAVPFMAFFIVANILYALSLAWAAKAAADMGSAKLVNSIFFMFFIWLMSRYLDLFGSFLDRSLFFLVGGAGLIATAVALDRGRRKLQAHIKENAGDPQ